MRKYFAFTMVLVWIEIIIAQMTVNQNLSIGFDFHNIDSLGNVLSDSMEIRQFDKETGEDRLLGVIDISKYELPAFINQMTIEDWNHNRLLFSPGYQGSREIWYVMDLNTFEINRPEADSFNRFEGKIYISPDGEFLLGFREYSGIGKNQWQDSLILTTYLFNTDDYSLAKRLGGMAALSGIEPPSFFWGIEDSIFYLRNPYQYAGERDVLKFSIPNLTLIDSLSLKSFCDFRRAAVEDIKNDNILAFYSCLENGTMKTSYKLIDFNNKNLLNELILADTTAYKEARMSTDGQTIFFQTDQNSILSYDTEFNFKWSASDIYRRGLHNAIFKDGYLYIDAVDYDKINKISINSGQLIEQITIHRVEQ